jgi:hypothetical protein
VRDSPNSFQYIKNWNRKLSHPYDNGNVHWIKAPWILICLRILVYGAPPRQTCALWRSRNEREHAILCLGGSSIPYVELSSMFSSLSIKSIKPVGKQDVRPKPTRQGPARTDIFRTCRGGARYLAIAQNSLKFLRIEYRIFKILSHHDDNGNVLN